MKNMYMNKSNLSLEVVTNVADHAKGVFVIIGGSGNIDKDGNNKMFKMNIYRDISEQLKDLGFTSVRYSKRGTGLSEGKHNETGLSDLLSDLHEIVEHTRSLYENQKIFLLGHSEGAMIATHYANTHKVDGMVLISGAGIGLKDALKIQNAYLAKEIETLKGLKGKLLRLLVSEKKISKQQSKIFEKVENTNKDVIRVQLVPIAAKWMREHFEYESEDYVEMLSKTETPTLVIQGNKDAHTSLDFVTKIGETNNPNIKIDILENVDHILRDFSGNLTILDIKRQYKQEVKKPISDSFTRSLKEWVVAS